MNTWLKATLMVLGAACVLLLAGGFPLMGAPEVYRSGAMVLAGGIAGLLCLVGGWRLARGVRGRFIGGLVCTFFAASGVGAVILFGSQGIGNAQMGGAMWFGAAAMFCLAAVGAIFVGVFGFFAWRAMYRRLWLAAIHWALAFMVLGSFLDYHGEISVQVAAVPGSGCALSEVSVDGGRIPLGFSLYVEKFDVAYYPEVNYTLYRWQDGKWEACGKPVLQGSELVLENRRWPVQDLRRSPRMPQPFILAGEGDSMELLMQDSPTVRDYCATCRVESDYRGRAETRTVEIRVNEPLSFKGWVVYLQSWRPMGQGALVELKVRHAPGRLFALGGMVGLVIATACWCWKRREEDTPAAPRKKNTTTAAAS